MIIPNIESQSRCLYLYKQPFTILSLYFFTNGFQITHHNRNPLNNFFLNTFDMAIRFPEIHWSQTATSQVLDIAKEYNEIQTGHFLSAVPATANSIKSEEPLVEMGGISVDTESIQ